MDTIIHFSKLAANMESLSPNECMEFVSLWNEFFGKTLGSFIESPAEAYALCSAEKTAE